VRSGHFAVAVVVIGLLPIGFLWIRWGPFGAVIVGALWVAVVVLGSLIAVILRSRAVGDP